MRAFKNFVYDPGVPAPSGSPVLPVIREKVGATGAIEIVYDGERNVYDEIQAADGLTDPYDVLDYMARNGAESVEDVIKHYKGEYLDVSAHPRSLVELEQLRLDGKNAFYRLPPELRALFGNSYEVFTSDPVRSCKIAEEYLGKDKGGPTGKVAEEGGAAGAGAATPPAGASHGITLNEGGGNK